MNARNGGLLLAALLGLCACDTDNVAGTNNETHTKGTLYQANGKVAAGARVRIFAANQAVGDSLPIEQTKADAQGRISLKLERGYYSLLANDTAGRAVFIDSILSNGDNVEFENDTLRPTGTFTGHLRVQPMHSPAIAWVHVLRTNLFANVDSSGAFRLEGVPEGKMELVALSHLPEYTPTFRKAQAFSDSTVDIGTLDLVYNGLPLVTGIAASYDSLSGVVTVTWKDTSFARKAGYVVYRSLNSSSFGLGELSPQPRGYASRNQFQDTVFGDDGSAPNRYDTTRLDLVYRVAIQSNDFDLGPTWNTATLSAKSPALAKRWQSTWSSVAVPLPITNNGNWNNLSQFSLDTLETGLAIVFPTYGSESWSSRIDSIVILGSSGEVTRKPLPSSPDFEAGPFFWQGRIWRAVGVPTGTVMKDSIHPSLVIRWPVFDSVRILSSRDAESWDTINLPISRDSITGFRLNSGSNGFALAATYCRHNKASNTGNISYSKLTWTSKEGRIWVQQQPTPDFLSGFDGMQADPSGNSWAATVHQMDDGRYWTVRKNFFSEDQSWIIPGESIDTSLAIARLPAVVQVSREYLALMRGTGLYITTRSTPNSWQILTNTSLNTRLTFWRGQLVALDETGLHFATITPNQ